MRPFLSLLVVLLVVCPVRAEKAALVREGRVVNCDSPPTGTIRFTLISGDAVDRYEWVGRSFRRVDAAPHSEALVWEFKSGSYFKWNYWGPDMEAVSRQLDGVTLSTPYALSGDGNWIVAGAVAAGETSDIDPLRVVLIHHGSVHIERTFEPDSRIRAVAWSPDSGAIVMITRSEVYGKSSLRERFAAAIGHPIPYDRITLSVVGRDGVPRCSIVPAEHLPYGNGYVRWDVN
jgi:hypothetical protein